MRPVMEFLGYDEKYQIYKVLPKKYFRIFKITVWETSIVINLSKKAVMLSDHERVLMNRGVDPMVVYKIAENSENWEDFKSRFKNYMKHPTRRKRREVHHDREVCRYRQSVGN